LFPRSFRARLTWFFIIIVILPMVAVSVVLFRLVADSERGKSDARLGQAQTSASGLFRDEEARAAQAGRRIGQSPELAAAIRADDADRIDRELATLAKRTGATRIELRLDGGGSHVYGADRQALAASETTLLDAGGSAAGTLKVSTETVDRYVRDVHSVTGLDAVVVRGGDTLASTLEGLDGARLPARGETELDNHTYRLTRFTVPAWDGGRRLTVRLLSDEAATKTAITNDSIAVAGLLLAFLVLAFAFALTVSRALQSQVQRLLQAAKRLGSGELNVEVPTEGNDEFAALGSEFNAMARQLESRLAELGSERARLQHAIRRVGESFAKNLDRDALLEIVVQTAVDGVAANVGRASVRDAPGGPLTQRARVGENGHYDPVLDAVEAAVLEGRDAAELHRGDHFALSHPLRPSEGSASARVLGLITVAREDRPFSGAEQELFNYLASQAAVSIENVGLHETVQRQAVTDELTGLFNHRRFQEVMSIEVERSKRFEHALGLIMLDLDDFKLVNDRYGHLQGDQVLREVAHVLLDSSREIDEPARYGGEEMAIALPQTDLEGAYQFAERVRARIEALEVPMIGGSGVVKVTASLGAAALPQSAAADKDALVAAADAALYRAKRLGKNRVVRAG
jgi:diguanylate cyclase (GGDEF)-like protein